MIKNLILLPWTIIDAAVALLPDPFENDFAQRMIAAGEDAEEA